VQAGAFVQQRAPVNDGRDDVEFRFEQCPESVEQQRVVVSQQDSWT
jgi:hypothetical protein